MCSLARSVVVVWQSYACLTEEEEKRSLTFLFPPSLLLLLGTYEVRGRERERRCTVPEGRGRRGEIAAGLLGEVGESGEKKSPTTLRVCNGEGGMRHLLFLHCTLCEAALITSWHLRQLFDLHFFASL